MSAWTRPTKALTKAVRAARFEVHARYRLRPVEPGAVLYEAFAGSGALCNPEAIFRELLASPDQQHLRHIWVLDRTGDHSLIRDEFRRDRRVRFVTRDSPGYWQAVATSGYLVNNATFPPQFSKRPGQTYLNTWHGTPLKAMGYDMPGGAREAGNTLRNFVQSDFLLSQNQFMTDSMYRSAYKLDGLYRGRVIQEGYPRVDRQELDDRERASSVALLTSRGLDVEGRRIVLYAPTWRGDTFNDPSDDIDALVSTVADLQERVGPEFAVLLRTHQILERYVGGRPDLARILVPTSMPTNVALGLSDTLVTDFSSIFFDFLATGRRIAFYAPDRSGYDSSRGTAFPADELPGPVCDTVDELARAVVADASDPWLRGPVRDAWQRRFTSAGKGESTRRVVDIVFRGKTDGYDVRSIAETNRTSILVHVGNLASNGITSSALNLLKALPADRFDVSIAYTRTRSRQQIANTPAVPSTVRHFLRDGGMNGTKWHHLRRRNAYRRGDTQAHLADPIQHRLWDDEWTRCFGDVRFDRIVDFSGYSPLWAQLLLHSPETPRAMWMHNDLAAEVHRVVNGRKPLERSLPAIFGTFRHYDSLATVSKLLAGINERSLPKGTLAGKHIHAVPNLVDGDRVKRLRGHAPFADEEPRVDSEGNDLGDPDWLAPFVADDGARWFVTVGRYTREKNHERLLDAFAIVHGAHPETRLLIIGHGPLRRTLEERITELGLDGAAFITGALRNPFAEMSRASCFVLSSDYEGQPMVILEAAVLGLPVVSTDFASVADALPDPTIRVVAQEPAALAAGMIAFLDGEVPPSRLDVDAYNQHALALFLTAVGLPADGGEPPTGRVHTAPAVTI
jgi:CDP-glycerol glycerophosphotransferase